MDNQDLKSVNINGIFMILSNEGLKSDKTVTVVLSWAWNKNENTRERKDECSVCLSDSLPTLPTSLLDPFLCGSRRPCPEEPCGEAACQGTSASVT